MSGLFSSPKIPTVTQPKPVPMPDEELLKKTSRKEIARKAAASGGGRESTQLTDKLGAY